VLREYEQPVHGVVVQDFNVVNDENDNLDRKLEELTGRLKTVDLSADEVEAIRREIKLLQLQQSIVNVSGWLLDEPGAPDQIIGDTLDVGDKIAIIAPSKMKKSFFMLQMLICIAAGRDFLRWKVPKPRRIAHVQLEIQSNHFHERVINMAKALNIEPSDLEDRFHVSNCRGLGIEGPEGVELIGQAIERYHPEIVSFDPLYKIAAGAENAIEDGKKILAAFDNLARKGVAVSYVHHDAKGASGDRDIRDRGAGSNVISRDYDVCFTLTQHATNPDATVVEMIVRNYKPQELFTIVWVEDKETGGYCFKEEPGIIPMKKTSRTKKQVPPLSDYLPTALSILENEEMGITVFKETFKQKSGLSNSRILEFITWATAETNGFLVTRGERGRGKNKKWINIGRRIGDD